MLGGEEDGAAHRPRFRQRLPPNGGPHRRPAPRVLHQVVQASVRSPPPPHPVHSGMELDPPQTLRLHMRGYGNGGMRVDVDFPAPHVMYLRHG